MKISQNFFLLTLVSFCSASSSVTFPFDEHRMKSECTDNQGATGTFLIQNDCNQLLKKKSEVVGFIKSVGPVVCCVVHEHEPPKQISSHPKGGSSVGSRSKEYCEHHGAEKLLQLDYHIVGGTDSDIAEFPHIAALGYENLGEIEFDCGGALISNNFVITAAHCCTRKPPSVVRLGRVSK